MSNSILKQKTLQRAGVFLKSVYKSIAFYPVFITCFFLLLGILLLTIPFDIEVFGHDKWTRILLVKNDDAAKTILTSIVGGKISLMVFSFSMVMVVLNQASSNFSPRVLPNLIADRGHQFILGFYAGSIIFTFLVLIGLGSGTLTKPNIAIGVLSALIFMILSIGLFVYFIHNISKSIQLRNIIEQLKKSTEIIVNEKKDRKLKKPENTNDWKLIKSDKSGFFHGVFIQFASDYFKEKTHHVKVLPYLNDYIRKGDPILMIKEDIPESELQSLQESLLLSTTRHAYNNIENNLVKLKEIGVKAMSPGINDPGTMMQIIVAIECIMLEVLLLPQYTESVNKANKIKLFLSEINIELLVENIFLPIYQYSKNDILVIRKLKKSIEYLMDINKDAKTKGSLYKIQQQIKADKLWNT